MLLCDDEVADRAVRRNVGAGYHYFDKDTMRCFGSRVHVGFDLPDGSTIVVMSNRDRRGSVVNGRRHYYLVLVSKDGDTSRDVPGCDRYDVSKETGYWLSLRAAKSAAVRALPAGTFKS